MLERLLNSASFRSFSDPVQLHIVWLGWHTLSITTMLAQGVVSHAEYLEHI